MKLSISIPTYNRAKYLPALIDSIIADSQGMEVEICISDNASTDNTKEIVERYQQSFPQIVYYRWPENMGADRNFLKCVEIASGDYCWLMGSDDMILPGAIEKVQAMLRRHPDIAGMSINRRIYLIDMQTEGTERPFAEKLPDDQEIITGAENVYALLGNYFGYISGQVINRLVWVETVSQYPVHEYFNAYVHVYIIGRMLQQRPQWAFIKDKLVGCRSGNDSFATEGLLKRARIDLYGFEKIVRDLFGFNSKTYRQHMTVIATLNFKLFIQAAKLNNHRGLLWPLFIETTKMYWRLPQFWIQTFPLFLVPKSVARFTRYIYRTFIKQKLIKLRG
jgi:abequosyltransferase